MAETQTITRKIQIYPVGDKEEVKRVYQYIREGMEAQNRAMNQYMSALYVSAVTEQTKEDRKELNRLFSRMSDSKKGSAYPKDIEFPKGLATPSSLKMAVDGDFQKAMSEGLMYGNVSLPTYRKNGALLVKSDFVMLRSQSPIGDGLYHEYKSHTEFIKELEEGKPEVFLKFANGITFRLVFGNPHKSAELRSVIQNIFEEVYKVQGSSIVFDKSGRKIMLNLTLSIPVRVEELDENTVVGVDLGICIPAMCSLNTKQYIRQSIGSREDFFSVRKRYQRERKRLQKSLEMTKGGHGRKEKLKALDRFREKEANFAKTYNHFISRQVVDFAVKHHAKYINVEDLHGFDADEKLLRNWGYYQLQQQIIYKANLKGIEVRKVNPAYTSQVCSCCGHWEEGQCIDQSHFVCKACGQKMNADRNASLNIAKSTLFTDKKYAKMGVKERLEQAKDYYGIKEAETETERENLEVPV